MSFAISESQLKSHIENTADENDTPSESTSKTKFTFQTYKNPLVICTAFLLQFTAFSGISNLQSSLNTEANVGVNSLSIIYACLIISAIFLPHPLISILGLKWTIVMSQIPYLLYVAANYYPKSYIMYPAAGVVGLAAAPLWTSKCSYLTDIDFLVYSSHFFNQDILIFLCMLYILISLCSILIIICFLNQRRKASKDQISVMLRHSVTLLVSTAKHMCNIEQIYLIPLTIWSDLLLFFLRFGALSHAHLMLNMLVSFLLHMVFAIP
ncbi:unnamed protein product [Rotaria magnacalcarata]